MPFTVDHYTFKESGRARREGGERDLERERRGGDWTDGRQREKVEEAREREQYG